MSELSEKRIGRKEIYDGHIVHLVCDEVVLPNGKTAPREVCLHKGAVAVVPITDDGKILMERQFRYAHDRVFLEIPAGKLDSEDEVPLDAAVRELREETGARARSITPLGRLIPSPAILSEVIHLFLAEGLTFGERELDEDEFLDVVPMELDELYGMVMRGEIEDAKTQIAIMKVYGLKRLAK